jgi:hypothetical protein
MFKETFVYAGREVDEMDGGRGEGLGNTDGGAGPQARLAEWSEVELDQLHLVSAMR